MIRDGDMDDDDNLTFRDERPFQMIDMRQADRLCRWLDEEDYIDVTREDGETLLMRAVRREREDIVRLLLERGCDKNAQDVHGMNALHIAAWLQKPKAVGLLIDAMVPLDATDKKGKRPVDYVHDCESVLLLDAFLKTGYVPERISVDHCKSDEFRSRIENLSPFRNLLVAFHRGETTNIIITLIKKCTELDFFDEHYLTPLNLAVLDPEVKLMLDKGANPNYFKTEHPLISHMYRGALGAFRHLVDAGADIGIRENRYQKGRDLMTRAKDLNLPEYVTYLESVLRQRALEKIEKSMIELYHPSKPLPLPKMRRP